MLRKELKILTVPSITQQFNDAVLLHGGSAYFNVTEPPKSLLEDKLDKSAKYYLGISGSPNFTYRWFKDGVVIQGEEKSKFGLKKVTAEKR